MKTSIKGLFIGIPAGILIGWLIAFLTLPGLMFMEDRAQDDFDTTVAKLEELAKEAGWSVPKVHDLQGSMKKKLDKDVAAVKVLDLCKPEHAYEILSRDDERVVSNMMPCRVAVYERTDGTVWVSRMNTGVISKPMSAVVRDAMGEATADIETILESIIAE